MKISENVGVLHSFNWNYVKYTNMEGFCRDSHIFVNCNAVFLIQHTWHFIAVTVFYLWFSHAKYNK